MMEAVEGRYVRLLEFFLRHRWITPVVGLAVIASCIYPFLRIDKNFDASRTEVFIQARYDFSEELNLERKEQVVTRVEKELFPHQEELHARSIYSFWSDRWSLTRFYMEDGYTNEKAMAETRALLREILPEIPGVKLEVQEQGPMWHHGGGKRVGFQIVGEDTGVLADLAEEAKRRIAEIPGLTDPWSSSESGGLEISVDLDRALASRYGVPLAQPAEVISLTYRGRRMQRFRTSEGEREMRVTLDETASESVSQLRNLPLWTSDGEKIPLAALADFEFSPGPDRINRDNRVTSVRVGARYSEGTNGDYMPKVQATLDQMDFPFGYSYTFRDHEERRREQSREFLVNLGLALLLVFAVMAGVFESTGQAIGLMVALPFAIAGAVWTLYFTKTDFDQPAAVGLLLLIGVVVNNGIVMLEHINQYRRKGMPRHEAMIRGGRERLRPIIMTAITTLVGLVPIVVQRPALAGVYYYSMALVIMGGLVVSTFLTSVLLPTTTSIVEDSLAFLGRVLTRFYRFLRPRKKQTAVG